MKKRLLITSVVMMLVVAVALSTATYAWFSSNTSVKANAVTLTAATMSGDAILISGSNLVNATSASTEMDLADQTGTLYPATPLGADFWSTLTEASFQNLEINKSIVVAKTIDTENDEASYYTDEIYIYNLGAQSITLNSSTVELTYGLAGNDKEAVNSVRIAIIEQIGSETADGTAATFAALNGATDATLVDIYEIDAVSIDLGTLVAAGDDFDASAVYATVTKDGQGKVTAAEEAAVTSETFDGLKENLMKVTSYKATTKSAVAQNYGATESDNVFTQGIQTYSAGGFHAIGTASSSHHICNKYTVIMWLEGWDAQCTNAASAGAFQVAFNFAA